MIQSKKIILIILCILFSGLLQAQTVQWVKKGIGPGFDNGNAITSDELGNVYATGQIEYEPVFDGHTLSSYGSHDILVAKYNNTGNIEWIHSAGGKGGDVGNGIGVDAAHNTYVAGEVEQTANFGSGITLTSAGGNDVFLAKYNSDGEIQWAKRWGNTENDKALSIAVSPTGDCFITGFFTTSISFGGTTLDATGSRDVFIVKLNSSGTVQWAKKAGGDGDDRGRDIALNISGDIFLAGTFTHNASFSGTNISNSANYSAFIAKYNSNGSVQWVKSEGACCDTTEYKSISVDDSGNIYATGYFKSTVSFGNNTFTSSGSADVILTKYNSNGNLIWARKGGGLDEDIAYGVIVDNINNTIYITGNVSASGHFNNLNYLISGFKDIFVAAYNQDGDILWDKIDGGSHRDIGSAITVDKQGYIYTTGLFNGTANFDFYTITGYPDTPWADFYIDKLSILPEIAPSTGPSNLSLFFSACADLNISFTPGDGIGRIVIAHASTPVNANPVSGSIYNGNPVFGNGTNLGNGNYVVYNGTGSNVTVSGLDPGVQYYFSVIEYNGTGASNNYSTNLALTGNALTPEHSVNISGLQNSICAGDSLILTASGGISYVWSPPAGLSNPTGNPIIAKPQTTTDYVVTATDLNGCNFQKSFTIVVNPLPIVSFPNLSDVCANDAPVLLTTGSPSGGLYSGPGIQGGQFDPTLNGAGTFTLYYTYTDVNGCSETNPATIDVKELPTVSITPIDESCEGDSPITLNGNPSGGDFTGTGVSNGKFRPAVVGVGSYLITYTYDGSNGCSNTTTATAIVNALPNVDLGVDRMVCMYNSITISPGTWFSTYAWSNGSTNSSVIIDSTGVGIGTKTINVKVSDILGCFNRDTIKITFDPCLGLNDPVVDEDLNIFPSPFVNQFTITSELKYSYFIYDALGRLIENGKNIHDQISIGENLSPGVYFLELNFSKGKKVIPIIKSE